MNHVFNIPLILFSFLLRCFLYAVGTATHGLLEQRGVLIKRRHHPNHVRRSCWIRADKIGQGNLINDTLYINIEACVRIIYTL